MHVCVGYSWRSKKELISGIIQWISTYGRARICQPARTYLQQQCVDIGCSFKDLSGGMDDSDGRKEREREREREREGGRESAARLDIYIYIYIYIYMNMSIYIYIYILILIYTHTYI